MLHHSKNQRPPHVLDPASNDSTAQERQVRSASRDHRSHSEEGFFKGDAAAENLRGEQDPGDLLRTEVLKKPPRHYAKNVNSFSLGAQIGGRNVPNSILQEQQQLRDAMNRWTGDYTSAIREFAFLLRVDGDIHSYTKIWNIHGPQKAKRKRDWVEVEIGVPESWWREHKGLAHRGRLAAAVEEGLISMIELLQRNRHAINSDALLADWKRIRNDYLADFTCHNAKTLV